MSLLTHSSTIQSLYLAFYGRPADPAGLAFWTGQLDRADGDLGAILTPFIGSAETQVRFAGETVSGQIARVYEQLFNREPDAEGLAFWVGAVEKGHATLATMSAMILQGAQGQDYDLSQLRQEAADAFTAQVEASGSAYDGYASIEAARVLVRAVTLDTKPADVASLVNAAVAFVDVATRTPAVVDAIASGGPLLAMFDTPRGLAEPVALLQTLADTAKAAAGNPNTLDSLLRGGGMTKVLEVMPAAATLQDVADALVEGGLPAAVEVVYPTPPVATPEPVPEPLPEFSMSHQNGVLTLIGTSNDAIEIDLGTNTVTRAGQPVPVPGDVVLSDVVAGAYAGDVVVKGSVARVMAAMAVPDGIDGYRIADAKAAIFGGTLDARTFASTAVRDLLDGALSVKITDVLSIRENSLVDGLVRFDLSQLDALVDTSAPELTASVDGVTQGAGDRVADFVTNVARATVKATLSGTLDKGDYVQYSVDGGRTWSVVAAGGIDDTSVEVGVDTTSNPVVQLRVVDAAGNTGAPSMGKQITYDGIAPIQTVTIDSVSQDEGEDSPDNQKADFTTNDRFATVEATLSDALKDGEYVQFSLDGGVTWTSGDMRQARQGAEVFTMPETSIEVDGVAVIVRALDVSGSPTLQIRVVDAAGNPGQSSKGQKISYDDVAATQTVTIDSISQDDGADGSADNKDDFTTNLSNVTVKATVAGALAAGDYVQYSTDGIAWTRADGIEGNKVTISGLDVTGSPTLRIRVVDAAGNAGRPASQDIVYDAAGPAADVSIEAVSQGPDDVSTTDYTTNVARATLTVELTDRLGGGERVQYSTDGRNWSDVADDKGGDDVVNIEGIDLSKGAPVSDAVGADKQTTVYVRLIDAAGNATAQPARQVITYDDSAPDVGDMAFSQVSPGANGAGLDNVTNVAMANVEFTYTGTGLKPEEGERYQWSTDGETWHASSPEAGGVAIDVFAATRTVRVTGLDLSKGAPAGDESGNLLTTVYLRSIDAAGNKSAPVSKQIVYDHGAAAPSLSLTTDSKGENVGTAADAITNVGTYTLKGVETGAKVEYSLDGESGWTDWGDDGLPARQGENSFWVRQTDKAGNTSAKSHIAFTFDDVKPDAPVIALASDTGVGGDGITNSAKVNISGLEGGKTIWEYSLDSGKTWTAGGLAGQDGTAVLDLTGRGDGAKEVLVRQVDVAGNEGAALEALTFTVDTKAPAGRFSFAGVEGGTDALSKVTGLAKAAVSFHYDAVLGAGDLFEYRLDGGSWLALDGEAYDPVTGFLSIDVDFSARDHEVEVRVADVSGNAGVPFAMSIDSTVNDGPTGPESMLTGMLVILRDGAPKIILSSTPNAVVSLADKTAFTLESMSTGAPVPVGSHYFDGPALQLEYAIMTLAAMPDTGLYRLGWKDGSFKTANDGYLGEGHALFAGGRTGNLIVEGFEAKQALSTLQDVHEAGSTRMNTAFIGASGVDVTIRTGGGNDVVADNGSKLTVIYDQFIGGTGGYDLILGFDSGDDRIGLEGFATALVDDNTNGELLWATASGTKLVLDRNVEAVKVTTSGFLSTQAINADIGLTVATLNAALGVGALRSGDDLLILAGEEDHGILYYYKEASGNGMIDFGELTTVFAFADGAIDTGDIVLVGIPA